MRIFWVLLICICFACNHAELNERKQGDQELFSVLGKDHTGIDFNNRLEENTLLNGFVYEYYYNGAGVAIADFNNDGLQDIYFVSNRRANRLYLNEGNLEFKNVTKRANTSGSFGFPTGVTIVDINNDGLKDIYISKSGRIKEKQHLRNELLINQGIDKNGIPSFKESAKEYGLDLPLNSTQATFFDYDRDGDLDMFLINHGIDTYDERNVRQIMAMEPTNTGERLYRNDDGKFKEATQEAGIVCSRLAYTLGVSIGDVNNDGWPDVFTANDYSEKDHLYLNNQDGTFKESSLGSFGHISNFSMGSDIADINNDGLLDIMTVDMSAEDNYTQKTSMSGMDPERFYQLVDLDLHHQYMYNALHLNQGVDSKKSIPLFSNIEHLAGVSSTDWSWAPLFFDMDNDGFKDLFVSNGIKRDFRNNDFKLWHKKYHNEKREAALASGYLDKDAYMAEVLAKLPARKRPNYFYLNQKNLVFKNDSVTQPRTNSNGAAYADLDNDGDIDIVVNNSDDEAFIYRNNTSGKNHIKIKLRGAENNVDAIGARIEVILKDGRQVQENYFTRGFQSAMADHLHFGLGSATTIDTLKIQWPDGTSQYQTNLAANQTVSVRYQPIKEVIASTTPKYLFEDITKQSTIDFAHEENKFNDFQYESLIPHRMSKLGPALAVADVNADGLQDFYIGGASGQSGKLYMQSEGGIFKSRDSKVFDSDKFHEDTGALFLDADGDGDQDLYVVSGGNEELAGAEYYKDRFYENKGNGKFVKSVKALPDNMVISGLSIASGDYDADGDLDLFVGSRVVPRKYGQRSQSYILENRSVKGQIRFVDVTMETIPKLLDYTMVTDAKWVDFNQDSLLDLLITSEWGVVDFFENEGEGLFTRSTSKYQDQDRNGWWYSIAVDDLDGDGDLDIIAGNLGLNYKYKASLESPFHMYINDFDQNDSLDIVLAYNQDNKLYPLRGRECSSQQMPFIRKKFETYDAFAKADIQDVYGKGLETALHYVATDFSTGIFVNSENERFEFNALENSAQISSVNKILIRDYDGDGLKDGLLFGNLYDAEVETPRNDAGYGHFLKNMGARKFKPIPARSTGLYVKGQVNDASFITIGRGKGNQEALLVARNDDRLLLLAIKS